MTKIVELKPKSIPARLREAMRERTLVRLWRENLEPGSFTGYIGAVGQDRFLLWALGDYIGFDGLFVLRYRDVTRLESPDHHADFLEKAIQVRKLDVKVPNEFPLDDLQHVLAAAAGLAPVTSVYVDTEAENEICYIGKLLGFEADGFTVQEVSPHAEWLREPSFFGWDEVSCISMNEPYALALAEVAGAPPPLEKDQHRHAHQALMPTPTALTLHRQSRLLEVAFDSGETFSLGCEYLRVHSPSAEVQGHGPSQHVLQLGKRNVNIVEIRPVGQYGVVLVFDDGHDTGIYGWDTLYALGRDHDRNWADYLAAVEAAGGAR